MTSRRPHRRHITGLLAGAAAVGAAMLGIGGLGAAPASAHGISSVVYADVAEGSAPGHLDVELQLEYDLFVVSAADAEQVDPLFQEGTEAWEYGDAAEQATTLDAYADTALAYVADRFTVSSGGAACALSQDGGYEITEQQGVPYAVLSLDAACGEGGAELTVTSSLFPDDELYVRGTETILTYDLGDESGSAVIDADNPEFSVGQSAGTRLWEFFVLGAEHLLFGIDHVLFLLALIAGSRRLREIVLAATAFTIAHSITFILAALQVFTLPAAVIEPIIALSIAIVAAWPLVRLWRRRSDTEEEAPPRGPLGMDRAGWIRLGVVFVFGLIHGMGFASALGIDEAWSWSLLWSLLVFNVGIEAVQVAIILVVFPLLVLLRRRAPSVARWVSGLLSAGVALFGVVWFVQRVFGWE
ncbi:HupE/UreJ family protein [Labedella populi]|uniref:HupE/UreJ family protein n=1 Tax=Labedella populi TaxID=2498850 RepID=A0A3S4BDK9_9MICO|nr:HupE/UreJ family protein [Labedella populi]RWZ68161.1 HupE/UreJ family protein [Labedella populi]